MVSTFFLKLTKVRVRDKDDEAKSQPKAFTYLFLEIICVYLLFSVLIKFKIGLIYFDVILIISIRKL